jgi:hypothetical protein
VFCVLCFVEIFDKCVLFFFYNQNHNTAMRRSTRRPASALLSSPDQIPQSLFRKRPRVVPSTPEEDCSQSPDTAFTGTQLQSSACAASAGFAGGASNGDDVSVWSQMDDVGSIAGTPVAKKSFIVPDSESEEEDSYSDDDSQCSSGNFSNQEFVHDSCEEGEEDEDESTSESSEPAESVSSKGSGSNKSAVVGASTGCPIAKLLKKATRIDKKIFFHNTMAEKYLAEAYSVDFKIRALTKGSLKSQSVFIPKNLVRDSGDENSRCATQ